MKLFKTSKFATDETGAVTVDWVVLTAAIVGVAIAMIGVVRSGVMKSASEISATMDAQLT